MCLTVTDSIFIAQLCTNENACPPKWWALDDLMSQIELATIHIPTFNLLCLINWTPEFRAWGGGKLLLILVMADSREVDLEVQVFMTYSEKPTTINSKQVPHFHWIPWSRFASQLQMRFVITSNVWTSPTSPTSSAPMTRGSSTAHSLPSMNGHQKYWNFRMNSCFSCHWKQFSLRLLRLKKKWNLKSCGKIGKSNI